MSTTPMNGSRDEPQPPEFLQSFYSLPLQSPLVGRPYVTLTYAQSLDARIAGVGGKQLILSGKESMVMTHWFDI
jgi:2,5-diamino-6-(ribosylamino)-4(3H)-pyrimidinone 5'-phosphate reductase